MPQHWHQCHNACTGAGHWVSNQLKRTKPPYRRQIIMHKKGKKRKTCKKSKKLSLSHKLLVLCTLCTKSWHASYLLFCVFYNVALVCSLLFLFLLNFTIFVPISGNQLFCKFCWTVHMNFHAKSGVCVLSVMSTLHYCTFVICLACPYKLPSVLFLPSCDQAT